MRKGVRNLTRNLMRNLTQNLREIYTIIRDRDRVKDRVRDNIIARSYNLLRSLSSKPEVYSLIDILIDVNGAYQLLGNGATAAIRKNIKVNRSTSTALLIRTFAFSGSRLLQRCNRSTKKTNKRAEE